MADDPDKAALAALTDRIGAHPVQGSPADMRRAFAALAGRQAQMTELRIGDVACHAVGSGGPGVLWLHGGGYVFGGVESHANCASALSEALGGRVILPVYPRAPEHLWPAQLTTMQGVLEAMPGPVHLVGDSAGGHLALTLAMTRPGRVQSLSLISPNTDRTGKSGTRRANSASDPMNDDAQDSALAGMVGLTADVPLASPLLQRLDGLPPTFVTYSDTEVLADDARLLADAIETAGVAVTRQVTHGLPHMWTLWPDTLPQAARSIAAIAGFIREHGASP